MKTLKSISKPEFDKLSDNDKRVLIAKDVIAQLDAKKFVASRGDYFKFKVPDKKLENYDLDKGDFYNPALDYYADMKEDTAQTLIKESTCYVCAKGAAVCSFVQKFNERKIVELDESDDDVVEIFGRELWDELERHFEGWDGRSKKSLRWLMNNIIENKGYLKVRGFLIG